LKITIPVNLEKLRYSVFIAEGGRHLAGKFLVSAIEPCQIFLVVEPVVMSHFGKDLKKSLEQFGFSVELFEIHISEQEKNLANVEKLYGAMMASGIDRHGCVVSFGGGVLGDVVGFAAATYLRGINFVQVPTTLLAQVDASIGGKVGVNFGGAKNLVGSFYQPKAVVIDPLVLETLEQRQFLNGMAEVIKYGAISNVAILDRLESSQDWLKGYTPGFFPNLVDGVKEKVRVVELDEHEHNVRAILNFGHTLGHALEMECDDLFHGEAVILGMRFASRLSQKKGLCDEETVERLLALLDNVPVAFSPAKVTFSNVWQRLIQDKKRKGSVIRFVLLKRLGEACVAEVDKAEIEGLFHETKLWWR